MKTKLDSTLIFSLYINLLLFCCFFVMMMVMIGVTILYDLLKDNNI